jgi:hypothetical protein
MRAMPQALQSRPAMVATVAIATGALLGGIWLLRTFDPNAPGSWFPSCVFHDLTGLYCPGCGITRALHALVHFDLQRAFAMNAFFVLSLPLLAAMALQATTRRALLPAALQRIVFDGRWWIGALLIFGLLRNLPAFARLAPGGLL